MYPTAPCVVRLPTSYRPRDGVVFGNQFASPLAVIAPTCVCGRNLQVVADTLHVSGDDEVEDWVLRAIQAGLMEAKMDQMQRVVVIRRCTNRVFGPAQWKVALDSLMFRL